MRGLSSKVRTENPFGLVKSLDPTTRSDRLELPRRSREQNEVTDLERRSRQSQRNRLSLSAVAENVDWHMRRDELGEMLVTACVFNDLGCPWRRG